MYRNYRGDIENTVIDKFIGGLILILILILLLTFPPRPSDGHGG